MNMFRKLRNNFLLLNMAVTSLVMAAAFGVVYLATYGNINAENERKLNNVGNWFAVANIDDSFEVTQFDPRQGVESVSNPEQDEVIYATQVAADYAPSFILIVDGNGNIVYELHIADMPKEFFTEAAKIAWKKQGLSTMRLSGRLWMYNVVPAQRVLIQNGTILQEETGEYQIYFLDITDTHKTLSDLLWSFLLVGIVMLAVIFFISRWFANRSIRPVSESWEKQKQFIADASHELKTPLTIIMTNCGALEANADETIKSQREWLDSIKIGADRMNGLVSSLLTLARAEGMPAQEEKQPFHLDAIISDIMRPFERMAQEKNLNISRDIAVTHEIVGYGDAVRQILTTLYENAVKYADEGGSIQVAAHGTKDGIACLVKNTGKGIAPGDLPHVFDRFYRADAARTGEDNSYGLGLSIAQSMAAQIGGKITAHSEENGWTEFSFTFEG
jgi:signal transduction histidine kinase